MYLNIVSNDQQSNYGEMQPTVGQGQQDQKWGQSNQANGWHTPAAQTNGWHTPANQSNGWHTPANSYSSDSSAKVLQVGSSTDVYNDPTEAASNLSARMAISNPHSPTGFTNSYGQSQSSSYGQTQSNTYGQSQSNSYGQTQSNAYGQSQSNSYGQSYSSTGSTGSSYSGAGSTGSSYSGTGSTGSSYSGTGSTGSSYSGTGAMGSSYSGTGATGSSYSGTGSTGSSYSSSGSTGSSWNQTGARQPQTASNSQTPGQTLTQGYSSQTSQMSSNLSSGTGQYQQNYSLGQSQQSWNQAGARQSSIPSQFSTIKQDSSTQPLQEGSRMAVYTPSATTPAGQMQTNNYNRAQMPSTMNQSATSSFQSNSLGGQGTSSMSQVSTNPVQPGQMASKPAPIQPARLNPPYNSPHAPTKPSIVNFTPRPPGQSQTATSAVGQNPTSSIARPFPGQSQGSQSTTGQSSLSSSSTASMMRPSQPVGRPSLASQLSARGALGAAKPGRPEDKPASLPAVTPAQNSIPCAEPRKSDTAKETSSSSSNTSSIKRQDTDTVFGSSNSDIVFGSSNKTSQDSSDDIKTIDSPTKNKDKPEIFLDDESEDESDIKCDKCKQSFWFKRELVEHLRTVHNMSEDDQEKERQRKVAAAAAIREQMRKKALAKQMILYQRLQQKKMEEQRREVMANKQQLQRALARANETARLRQERKLAEERNSLELRREMQALQERKTRAKRLELQMLLDRRNRLMGRSGNSDSDERPERPERIERRVERPERPDPRARASRDQNNNAAKASSKASQRQIHLDSGIVIEALPF